MQTSVLLCSRGPDNGSCTEDDSVNAAPQILDGQYLSLGAFFQNLAKSKQENMKNMKNKTRIQKVWNPLCRSLEDGQRSDR